ncbi:acyl carrier protein [uncultured Paraglaciecola sp.]|uniref:acyl carrier protein n=1 Tax=uncultured Paraglaciecola sp. TaxID=1765024 RepID=UPI0030D916A6|tara:strand:+ start:18149 stop:18406 length:258 start_codon:yes stop_codon:yes gene_type:complete
MSQCRTQIRAILLEYSKLSENEINDEDDLENLGIDSLSLVEIIFDLEEMFDIKIPDEATLEEMNLSMSKVKDIEELITTLLEQKA